MAKGPRIQQVVKTDTVIIEPPKCYLVTRTDLPAFSGQEKFIRFRDGNGVLDLASLYRERPDWFDNVAGNLIQKAGNPLSSYVEWWERRHSVITEITPERAVEFREWIDAENRKDIDREVAAMKAKQHAKSTNLEGTKREQELMQEARARWPATPMPVWPKDGESASVGAQAPAPHETGETAPVAPTDSALVPPHESGQMNATQSATGGGGTGNAE